MEKSSSVSRHWVKTSLYIEDHAEGTLLKGMRLGMASIAADNCSFQGRSNLHMLTGVFIKVYEAFQGFKSFCGGGDITRIVCFKPSNDIHNYKLN